MTMTRRLMAGLLALLVAVPVLAQNQRMYSQPELDQMLAPIALYPDPLLSQILMAATYPDEVQEAAAWSRANPDLQGDAAVRAVQFEDWDPSVKSLAAFPQVLARMAENPQWMQSLGEAFLAQEPHVMDAVQQLRRRAQAAGNLQSSEQLQVQHQGPAIVIQPASPQVVYVPYYDPYVVYGQWWWPAYRPVVWSPWPRPYRVYLSAGFFFGNFDWHRHHVHVVHPAAYYYRHRHAHAVATDRGIAFPPQRWRHEPQRRAAHAERRAVQVQVPLRPHVQPHAPAPRHETRTEHRIEQRSEQRVERRQERREERREERPDERRQLRQVQPSAPPVAPVVRTPAPVQRAPAPVLAAPTPAPVRVAPAPAPVQVAPAPAPVQAAPAVRMPAASAPPQPRAERREQHQEQRQERREQRQEQRQERREQRQEQRGQKG